ncbi:hypothetical protein P170DRAFT_438924 [Aspergillus steynii IBT 23096]|uniref:Uncharacterized protein n=1 Tax=Aspergillus steynii IBT 23096 TaxID=1392250 RepID=A0A2I2G2X6_9EURO|nr:uncharacterized protein P170DRAFT_438924 [Aspergillus steynii IBT 23096]PLB47225.1 hypothetical protein P170DRAFT_438924 [Aspergillus steynii IBT 23096]
MQSRLESSCRGRPSNPYSARKGGVGSHSLLHWLPGATACYLSAAMISAVTVETVRNRFVGPTTL